MTNPNSGSYTAPPRGATSSEQSRRRTPWWLWLLLGLLALAVLLFGLSQCSPSAGTDPGASGGAAPTGAADPGAAAPGSAGDPSGSAGAPAAGGAGAAGAAAGGAGVLTAGGTSLLPLGTVAGPDGSLTGLTGQPAAASGATVVSVPADEGFWVGSSETDRVWVQLTGTGESGYVVTQGDRVEFTGTVVAHDPGFAGQIGVDPAEGAEQLTAQGAHLEVPKSELREATG
jgi:hypothetical protein